MFANRIVDKWNVLPEMCMECTTVNEFKSRIKLQLEPKHKYIVMFVMLVIVDFICLLMPSV